MHHTHTDEDEQSLYAIERSFAADDHDDDCLGPPPAKRSRLSASSAVEHANARRRLSFTSVVSQPGKPQSPSVTVSRTCMNTLQLIMNTVHKLLLFSFHRLW